jgi:hypothetical protein
MEIKISDLNKIERYKKYYLYREKLMEYPNSLRPQVATKYTAEYFGITIQTVYNAIRENRK